MELSPTPLTAQILVAATVLAVAFVLRALPHTLAPLGIGVDHWYWRAYVEAYRRDRTIPPRLPQYLLEPHHWYPPVFPLLVSLLPRAIFERWSHLLAALVDLLRLVLLMAVVHELTGGNAIAVGVSGGTYALTPLLVSHNVQLTPRGLGALVLDLVILTVLGIEFFGGSAWLWPALILPASGLLLLTHKMTTQLFWSLCLVAAIGLDWRWLLLIPASMALALLLSAGFYWKVLLAHWDIVSFWNKHWPWAGANPIRESPIYGRPTAETPRKLHRKGLRGIIKHCYLLVGYAPLAWLALVADFLAPPVSPAPAGVAQFVLAWLGWTLLLAVATSLVASLRCLGAGYLYLYNAAFPAAILWGLLAAGSHTYTVPLLALGAAAACWSLSHLYGEAGHNTSSTIDPAFQMALQALASRPRAAVMCVPPDWHDVVAYKTKLPVLAGGHGYGFEKVEATYPRLLVRVGELIERFDLRYILCERAALTDAFVADLPPHGTEDFGKFRIISIEQSTDHDAPGE